MGSVVLRSFGIVARCRMFTKATYRLRLSVKVGDLVKFKHPDFQESYGPGFVSGFCEEYFSVIAFFMDEFIHATEDELEVISESR